MPLLITLVKAHAKNVLDIFSFFTYGENICNPKLLDSPRYLINLHYTMMHHRDVVFIDPINKYLLLIFLYFYTEALSVAVSKLMASPSVAYCKCCNIWGICCVAANRPKPQPFSSVRALTSSVLVARNTSVACRCSLGGKSLESSGVRWIFVSGLASTAAGLGFLGFELDFNFLKNTHCCITIITFSQAAVWPLSTARGSAAKHCPYLYCSPKERLLL